MQGLLRNIGWLLCSRGINAAFSLLYLALATRSLGLEGYGYFALIVVLAQAISGIASFSTWQAVVRWGAAGEARSAVGFALALDLVSIAVGGVVAIGVVWTAPYWLQLPADLRPTALALCFASLLAIRSTPTGILRLHDRFAVATTAEAVLPATRAAGAIVVWHAWPTITGFVAAWAVAELACAAAYWRLALPLQPIGRRDISLRALPGRQVGAWRFVLATNVSRTLAVTAKQVLVLLIGAIGGAALAGGFRIAAQLGQSLVQLAGTVSRAIYPELVRTYHAADRIAGRMTMLALVVAVLATGLAALFGQSILVLLAGPRFAFAAPAMTLLVVAGAVELLGASWDALLVARDRPGTVFVLRAVPLAAAVLALPSAIGAYGATGAAACVALASLAAVVGMGYAVRQRPGVSVALGASR